MYSSYCNLSIKYFYLRENAHEWFHCDNMLHTNIFTCINLCVVLLYDIVQKIYLQYFFNIHVLITVYEYRLNYDDCIYSSTSDVSDMWWYIRRVAPIPKKRPIPILLYLYQYDYYFFINIFINYYFY